MQEHVTLISADAPSTPAKRDSSVLPPDLQEQVRRRLRLLALLLLFAFSFDPALFSVIWVLAVLAGQPIPVGQQLGFIIADLGGAIISALVWWIARKGSVPPRQLQLLGLVYQIAICFQISVTIPWQWYLDKGHVPPLTWVPMVIVLFPLIVPAPPRRTLLASLVAGAMSPLGLALLEYWGKVTATADDYFRAVVGPGVGIVFAYIGSRVVYGLGREIVAARELGSYRLERRLGAGGMGEVWSARHRLLARPAAIKLIRSQSAGNGRPEASPDLLHRFEREAQVIAQLRSPHTVDLFDFGVADDGAFYYVMELLEGLDADSLVRRFGPIPPQRAIFLLDQICHSLSEAESYGLIHRDIKPANIFLCRYGEDCDFVKVLDFGLVKAMEDPKLEPALTAENVVQGTPAFIAPEQALGRASLDSRVDIYAIGCVAYWLLTGQLVFSAPNAMGLLMHHIHTVPLPPSTRTELSVPAALDQLILDCLAKDPAGRPQSASELSRRLGEIDETGVWTQQHAREWWAIHLPAQNRHPVGEPVPAL